MGAPPKRSPQASTIGTVRADATHNYYHCMYQVKSKTQMYTIIGSITEKNKRVVSRRDLVSIQGQHAWNLLWSVWHRDRFPSEYIILTSSITIAQIHAIFIYLIVKTTSILANASVFNQNTWKEEEKGRTVPRPSEYSLNTFHIMLLHLLDLSANKNNAIMSI